MAKKKSSYQQNRMMIWSVVLFFVLIGLPTAYYYWNDRSFKMGKKDFASQFPKDFPLKGIDISHHQGDVDWELIFNDLKLDTVINFVYCKATEGTDHIDTRWQENRKRLTNLGIIHGAYHFFNGKTPPRDQAAHFLKHWNHRDLDLAPMLDVESEGFSDVDLIAKMEIWLTVVEEQTGHRPIIYCSLDYFDKKFKNHFAEYDFWIAAYSRKPHVLSDPRVKYWQFSEKGELPGCDELVDLNVGR
jgi:lysozyme